MKELYEDNFLNFFDDKKIKRTDHPLFLGFSCTPSTNPSIRDDGRQRRHRRHRRRLTGRDRFATPAVRSVSRGEEGRRCGCGRGEDAESPGYL